MIELGRTIRFSLNGEGPGDAVWATPTWNSYSAWPAMRGLGRYYELTVCCRGEADAQTGYFVNIKHIDEAVRESVLPYLSGIVAETSDTTLLPMGELMQRMVGLLDEPLNRSVAELRLQLTPRYALEIRSQQMDHVLIRQQYEFSAAHRLHVDELSDAENQRIFGKCNNPAGHGHNYRVEVIVNAPIDATGHVPLVEELDAVVARHVLDRLDHKHLNHDVPEFAQLNPSVEHIVQVVWGMLQPHMAGLGSVAGTKLHEVRVWETEKTVCSYKG